MTTALEGGERSASRPGRTLTPGKTRYPFYRRLGGPQGRSGRAENLVPTRIQSLTVQPVVSRYTDWATRPTRYGMVCWKGPGHVERYRTYTWISLPKKTLHSALTVSTTITLLALWASWSVLGRNLTFFFNYGATALVGQGLLTVQNSWSLSVGHPTLSKTPLDERSARRRDLCLTTHNTLKRQTPTPPVGFEPIIPAYERPQTHSLGGAATGIGEICLLVYLKYSIFIKT